MAEEEIIILESDSDGDEDFTTPIGEDAIDLEQEQEQINKDLDDELEKKKKKKLLIYGFAVFLATLLIVILIFIFSLQNSQEAQVLDVNTTELANKINEKSRPEQFTQSKLENMIKKANVLYERGNKNEALKIYERIATFNEAISHYNIGVAQMKDKNFQEALESFKKAIDNQEQRCVSAINAAVCALELKNNPLFEYYIDLAYTYLPMENSSPLYSYYVGLINYYKNYNYEALSAFSHTSSEFYKEMQNYLSSKIFTSMDINDLAVNKLEQNNLVDDSLTLGLLYARLGEFNIALNHLVKATQNTNEPLKTRVALALVQNKLGYLEQSGELLKELYTQYGEKATEVYPIKVTLKDTLFDVDKAQTQFNNELFFNDERTYGLLFYFAPFKVFDAEQTINYIRKGSMNVFIDEIGPALSYLKKSSTISKVNISISQGIKKALEYHTAKANKIFKNMIETYPKHSILHYNLALTYAQMSNFTEAYKHFKKSYHLDNTNYLAGAFAILCGKLINDDVKRLTEDVKESINADTTLQESNLFLSLIHLSENNQLSLTRWMEDEKKPTPLHIVFDTIIAQKTFNEKIYRQKATILQSILPRDIMANIIDFNVKYNKNDIKEYAKAIQIEFKKLDLDYSAFYYGPRIAQEQYVKFLQIGGLLHQERKKILKDVELERDDIPAIMQTLAYLSIYTNDFEEAYTLYNQLIDQYKEDDSKTVFLAAVASIGANHPENAVALLELSKLIDTTNNESRYGLGLLYHQEKNFDGAVIQYLKIGDSNFKSQYFGFKITK
jgi:tetratricopeptide (TPR) repeat protein